MFGICADTGLNRQKERVFVCVCGVCVCERESEREEERVNARFRECVCRVASDARLC